MSAYLEVVQFIAAYISSINSDLSIVYYRRSDFIVATKAASYVASQIDDDLHTNAKITKETDKNATRSVNIDT